VKTVRFVCDVTGDSGVFDILTQDCEVGIGTRIVVAVYVGRDGLPPSTCPSDDMLYQWDWYMAGTFVCTSETAANMTFGSTTMAIKSATPLEVVPSSLSSALVLVRVCD
jgi:hypothetical protein